MTLTAREVQLFSVPSDFGRGANEGCYYPLNLLLIASHLRRAIPEISVEVVDRTHDPTAKPDAPIVGISASSTQNYAAVLSLAQEAKASGSIVVIGGPHTSYLADQILRNRPHCIDYVIRGYGERSFAALVTALRTGSSFEIIEGLSWRDQSRGVRHNPVFVTPWVYEVFLPVDFTLLRSGIRRYWEEFRQCLGRTVDAAFLVFTHFGCDYRNRGIHKKPAKGCLSSICSYCSQEGPIIARSGHAIISEALAMFRQCRIPPGSKILLKCYGDNVGKQLTMLTDLAETIEKTPEWHQFDIEWTFYCRSSCLSERTATLLARVGARHLYIGFDSADDTIQRMNGLGTSLCSHEKAIGVACRYNMGIQAGFVLGCAGESAKSLEMTVSFAERLGTISTLEHTNSAVLIIMPGAPAYNALCIREPWIRNLDLLPTRELQLLWLKHFCPDLGGSPQEGMALVENAANRIDQLSRGPHASMGFVSNVLASKIARVCPK